MGLTFGVVRGLLSQNISPVCEKVPVGFGSQCSVTKAEKLGYGEGTLGYVVLVLLHVLLNFGNVVLEDALTSLVALVERSLRDDCLEFHFDGRQVVLEGMCD